MLGGSSVSPLEIYSVLNIFVDAGCSAVFVQTAKRYLKLPSFQNLSLPKLMETLNKDGGIAFANSVSTAFVNSVYKPF